MTLVFPYVQRSPDKLLLGPHAGFTAERVQQILFIMRQILKQTYLQEFKRHHSHSEFILYNFEEHFNGGNRDSAILIVIKKVECPSCHFCHR